MILGLASTSVRRRLGPTLIGALACALLAAGCSNDSGGSKDTILSVNPTPSPDPSTVPLSGAFVSASTSGAMRIVVPDGFRMMPVGSPRVMLPQCFATIVPDGGSEDTIPGSYDPTTHVMSMAGSGYTFRGSYAATEGGFIVGGGWTGAGGPGTFEALTGTSSNRAYRGTIVDGNDLTVWNVALFVQGSTVFGMAAPANGGDLVRVSGVTSGSTEALELGFSGSYTDASSNEFNLEGSGSFGADGSSLYGKWSLVENFDVARQGSWSADRCP